MISKVARRIDPFDHLAASDFVVRLSGVRHDCGVVEDLQGLFEGREILVPDQYGGWSAVAGDNDTLVLALGWSVKPDRWSRTVHSGSTDMATICG